MKLSRSDRWRVFAFMVVIGLLAAACSGGTRGARGRTRAAGRWS